MECIEINVRKETAEKWRNASSEMKTQIKKRIEMELANEPLQEWKDKPKPAKKNWNYLGSVAVGGKADTLNIRDFAHDD